MLNRAVSSQTSDLQNLFCWVWPLALAILCKKNFDDRIFGWDFMTLFSGISLLEHVCLFLETPVYCKILWPHKFTNARYGFVNIPDSWGCFHNRDETIGFWRLVRVLILWIIMVALEDWGWSICYCIGVRIDTQVVREDSDWGNKTWLKGQSVEEDESYYSNFHSCCTPSFNITRLSQLTSCLWLTSSFLS